MGCLKTIIKIIILALAIIGFISLKNSDGFKNIKLFEKPSQEKLQQKASDIADLSNINEEFFINKNINILGYKAVLIEHKGSTQKIAILKTGNKSFLTKKDFSSKEIDNKIKEFIEKTQYQFIRLEDFDITSRGYLYTMGQLAPYIKFEANTVNLPMPTIQGIISVATDKETNKDRIILSINNGKKYSQIITQQLLKDVK